MKKPIELGDALNEFGWWSSWAKPFRPTRESYGLLSKGFPEPLFNRVVFLSPPKNPHKLIPEIVRHFRANGVSPSFFAQDTQKFAPTRTAIVENGLRRIDRFLIMELLEPRFQHDGMTSTHMVQRSELVLWSRIYLKAFYGNEILLEEVLRSVKTAHLKCDNRLLLATRKGKIVGTMALHVSDGYAGVYCLGTLPSMRGKGVASSMLAVAHEYASKLQAKTILQVFETDGIGDFYMERGFRRLYDEEVFGEG